MKTLVRFAAIALLVGASARARDESLTVTTDYTLSARDPVELIADLTPSLPATHVVLSQQDALARELRRRSYRLSGADVERTAAALVEEGCRAQVDPLMLLSVIYVESYFDPLAVSPVGAEGLMQLMPYTAVWVASEQGLDWSENNSFEPVLNVRLGSRYLADLYEQFDNWDLALTAYNRGPTATRYLVRKHGALPQEIRQFYADKVLTKYKQYKNYYGHLPLT